MPVGGGGSTGGASAGDIRAGGAFFEIVGKDNISKTLDQIGGKVKSLDRIVKSIGGLSFAGSFLGGLAGGNTLMSAIQEMGQATADWVLNAKLFNKELERSQKLTSELARTKSEGLTRRDADIDRQSIGLRIQQVQDEINQARLEIRGSESALKAARKPVEAPPTIKNARARGLSLPEAILESTQRGIESIFDSSVVAGNKTNLEQAEATHQANLKRLREQQFKLEDLKRERDEKLLERSSKDFFSVNGLNPIVSALRPLVTSPEAMWDLRQRTIEREFNLRGTSRTFGGIGSLLTAGLGALEKMGPQLELMRTAGEIRTGGGGQNALQRFGVGQNVAELSLKAQQLIAKNTEPKNLAKEVGAAVAGALVLR